MRIEDLRIPSSSSKIFVFLVLVQESDVTEGIPIGSTIRERDETHWRRGQIVITTG